MAEGGFLPPVVAELRANITEFQAKMAEARGEMAATESKGSASFAKLAAVGKGAMIGLGVAAVAVGVIGIKAALDMEVAQKRLETAVKNSGQSYGRFSEDVEEAEAAGRKLGFSNEDVVTSLAKLQPVTKDVHKSIADMSLAEDIARGRHIELGAATDILVKVETGRVGMLGRIGISTKDATGATISQEEAVRRLTAMYGGQASAYAETFRGKMEALGAQAENIAEKIGQFLIPILMSMGTAIADSITWLTQHKTVLIALGVVIGGALVAAMTAYIATALIAFATTGALGTAIAFTSGIIFTTILPAIGSFIAFLGSLTIAEALASAGLTLAFAAIAVGIGWMIGQGDAWDRQFDKNRQTGQRWGDTEVRNAHASGDAYNKLSADLVVLGKNIKARQELLARETGGSTEVLAENEAYMAQNRALIENKAQYAVIEKEVNKLRESHQKQLEVAGAVAESYGIVIPNAYAMSSQELKAMQKGIKESAAQFGQLPTEFLVNAHATGAAMHGLVQESQQFAADLAGSIAKATDPFAHDFGTKGAIAEADMEKFFVESNAAALQWTTDLQTLMATGVDKGIIENLARAGPESEPKLQAFQAMVDLHGADWVNSQIKSGNDAVAAASAAFDRMAVVAAIKSAEIAAITKAYMLDMKEGGTRHLEELANSTDTNFRNMAYDAAVHMAEVRDAANTPIPPVYVGIVVTGEDTLDRVIGKLNSMPEAQRVAVALGYGAHGMVALARGGAGRIVGPNQPVVIGEGLSREAVVPFDNFGDMVATIRNTGKANAFSAAAAAAGGGGGASSQVHYHTHHGNINIYTPDGEGARQKVAAFLEGRR